MNVVFILALLIVFIFIGYWLANLYQSMKGKNKEKATNKKSKPSFVDSLKEGIAKIQGSEFVKNAQAEQENYDPNEFMPKMDGDIGI